MTATGQEGPSRRRAPRTDTSSPVLRRRLQEAALEIAAVEGYHAASLRRISTALDLRTATVYSVFPGGKQELVTSGLVALMEDFWALVRASQREGAPALENLRAAVGAHLDDAASHPALSRAWNALVASDRASPFMEDEGRRRIAELRSAYVDLLTGHVAGLGVDPFQARCWGGLISTMCDSTEWFRDAVARSARAGQGPADADVHSWVWLAVLRLIPPEHLPPGTLPEP